MNRVRLFVAAVIALSFAAGLLSGCGLVDRIQYISALGIALFGGVVVVILVLVLTLRLGAWLANRGGIPVTGRKGGKK